MKQTISVLVENQAGVLNRITGLFSRRAFNIESLAVGPTDDPTVSRITIIVDSGNSVVEQVEKQLNKLVEVIKVRTLDEGSYIGRELMILKVNAKIFYALFFAVCFLLHFRITAPSGGTVITAEALCPCQGFFSVLIGPWLRTPEPPYTVSSELKTSSQMP